jgi:hypothetical protein
MSEPDSGEYSVRSLAEILREHGLETELGTRPGRRRRTSDDPEVTGRSPRVEPAPRAPRPHPSGSVPTPKPAAARGGAPARSAPQVPAAGRAPSAAAAQARVPVTTWPDQSSVGSRPMTGLAGPATPVREPARDQAPAPAPAARSAPAQVGAADGGPAAGQRGAATGSASGRSGASPSPVRPARRKSDARLTPPPPDEPQPGRGPTTSAIPAAGSAAARRDAHPVTGPIPVQRGSAAVEAEDEEPLTGRESALAWARFAGELVVALAVGIGLYFAFTVLWELLPYVALVAAPVAVTGLVAGVAAWRQKTGQGPVGVRLLAVLLLAGTVLVIAPAARLLGGGG